MIECIDCTCGKFITYDNLKEHDCFQCPDCGKEYECVEEYFEHEGVVRDLKEKK